MVLHVKYPSMERQDLTQAQLGSFKFTPVDEARDPPHPHPLLLHQYQQSLENAGFDQRLTSPDIASDPSFSNHQIRPSLDNSRLRFGPAAVRAAVESASTSPQNRFSRSSQGPMRPNAQSFQPLTFGSSDNDSWPSIYTSEGSSAPMHDENFQAMSNANSSLLRALEAEQESHQATKNLLEQDSTARLEAEAETRRLAEHNKGLLNSIKLLQSTVKHMVQKENESSSMAMANVTSKDSILYDVMANYKVPHETVQDRKQVVSMIDLDLPSTPRSNDRPEKVELQQTLRKRKGSCSESEPNQDTNTDYQRKPETIVTNGDSLLQELENDQSQENQSQKENRAPINGRAAAPQSTTRSPAQTTSTSDFVYSLPIEFLNKYGKKPSRVDDKVKLPKTSHEEQSPPPQTPRKASLTVISAIKAKDFENDRKLPSRIVYMPDSPIIDWKVDGRHVKELRGKHVETHSESHFTTHPIRYVPTMADENIFRTIMVDFIPYGTSYSDLLAHVRGGTLEQVQMYGPIGDATDFVTARIIFTDETGATNLYRRGQDPGIFINGNQVRVWQVLEPTYPKHRELEEAIYVNGHTRILIVNAPLDDSDALLKQKLRKQIEAGLVLDIGQSHDGLPMVEFTSIEEATKALYRFLADPAFRATEFDFEDDYCAAKYPE